jgi:hypothetical protein
VHWLTHTFLCCNHNSQPIFTESISQQNLLPENSAIVICHKRNASCDGTFDEIHTVAFKQAFSKAFFPVKINKNMFKIGLPNKPAQDFRSL